MAEAFYRYGKEGKRMPDTAPVYPTLTADRIPEHSRHEIARFVIHNIWDSILSDPKAEKLYDAWQAERDARLARERNDEE